PIFDEYCAAGALAEEMPGRGKTPVLRMLDDAVQHLLVAQETIDAGPFPTGQTVPREIEGHDGQPVAQRPADHMAVQAHVVVVTVQNDQRAPRQARAPYLNRQVETINFNVTKVLIDLGAEVD